METGGNISKEIRRKNTKNKTHMKIKEMKSKEYFKSLSAMFPLPSRR